MKPQVKPVVRWAIILRYAMLADGQPRTCVNHKVSYPSRATADAAATEMQHLYTAQMHVYRCHLIPNIKHYHLATRSTGAPPSFPPRQVMMARLLLAAPQGCVTRRQVRDSVPPASRARNEEVRRVLARWEQRGFVRREGEAVVLVDRQGLLGWLDELLMPHVEVAPT
jgi:hypothetical protein